MKKLVKKSGVAVLSMAMLLSMGAIALPASAAKGDALTVKVSDVKYGTGTVAVTDVKVYQVAFSDSASGEWIWNAPFDENMNIEPKDLSKLSAFQLNVLANTLKKIAADNAEVAESVLVLSENNGTMSIPRDSTVSLEGEAYYLIVSATTDNEVVVQPTLKLIDGAGTDFTTVTPKANPLPLEKKITFVENGQLSQGEDPSDTSVATAGSKISYSITSMLPEYDKTNVTADKVKPFIITDDPSEGIIVDTTEFGANGSNVVVTIGKDVVTDVVDIAAIDGDDGFTVTVDGEMVYAHTGESIVVTFDATVSDTPVYGNEFCGDAGDMHVDENGDPVSGNPNTAKITWGNNYATGGYYDPANPLEPDLPFDPEDPSFPDDEDEPDEPTVEKKDTVTTYVGKITLAKQGDGVDGFLSGAEFTLTGSDNDLIANYTTGEDGTFDFGFLPAGTYVLTETKAPDGFKLINSTYTFTVKNKENANDQEFSTFEFAEVEAVDRVEFTDAATADDNASALSKANITVTDPPRDTLPGTGGIGTYVFTFGGLGIVLLAGVLFVIYMKKRKVQE